MSVMPSQLRAKKLLFVKDQCKLFKQTDREIDFINESDKTDRNSEQWKPKSNIHAPIRPQQYQTRSPARVLLICKTSLSILCQLVQEKLESHRISYKIVTKKDLQ